MNLRPLYDRVVLKRDDRQRHSPGGILIPDTAGEKPTEGQVIAVGRGKILDNGKVRPMDLKVGDRVLFGKYSGTEVKLGGEELIVAREEDVMAVLDDASTQKA
jgi:chaperonin GroES